MTCMKVKCQKDDIELTSRWLAITRCLVFVSRWVPLDSVKPLEPYDFQVKVVREPGSPLGLLGTLVSLWSLSMQKSGATLKYLHIISIFMYLSVVSRGELLVRSCEFAPVALEHMNTDHLRWRTWLSRWCDKNHGREGGRPLAETVFGVW